MKNIFTIILLSAITGADAQVIIGDAVGTATNKTSVLLEFAAENKGLILPYVRTLPSTPAEGTILLDASTATTARIKYYNGTWQDLSGQNADVTSSLASQPTGISENSNSKAIIGAQTSSADGVLVLESTTKAMVLPIVDDVQNIPSPSPGMMVYVKGVLPNFNKRLAVYNGAKWSFWATNVANVPTVITATGRVWMDRNLGATQVATSSTDVAAYGDLYQWGRLADGHEKKNSATTPTLSTTDVPSNGNLITTSGNPWDWRSPQNAGLWQGVNGINNPCPSGFRIPTWTEFMDETITWSSANAAGGFASPLKLPMGGSRSQTGSLDSTGVVGYYWLSDVSTYSSMAFFLLPFNANFGTLSRTIGSSVRCIRD